MTFVPGTRLGHYELLAVLASGGMSQLYRGRDTRLDRPVAIKVLPSELMANPDRRERFAREARAVSALSHPHICALYDYGSDNGVDYLVMEYLEGESLAERLIAGPLPLAKVLRYASEIADALDQAHRQGFIHRDLKPANVMVTKSGAMLLDFGLAKTRPCATLLESTPLSIHRAPTQSLTTEGTLIGTLHYMAPEQLEGREADARSDIFAFGALVYELVTGRRAFDGGSHASVIAAILSVDPPPLTDLQPLVPPALDRLIRKCLAKDPEERWQSVHDLKTALHWIEEAGSGEHPRQSAPARVHWRERLAWSLVALLLVVSVVAISVSRRVGRESGHDAKPISFEVRPPDGATLFSGGGIMALSPDGRSLVFVATPHGGKPVLWLRSLDSVAVQALVGTTDARAPFWSPDSRFVAFVAGGKLKKVDVTSGDILTLCEAGEAPPGTWGPNGEILFTSSLTGRIERVSAEGGHPIPVIGIDPSRGEFGLGSPHLLPDGRHFFYLVRSARSEYAGIFVGSLDGPTRARVLSEYSEVLYVPPGYLVFHREGSVFAQRFDPVTLKVSGDVVPVVNDVAFNVGTRRGAFSVSDTGTLAYRAAEDTVLAWFDRAGTSLGAVVPPGRYYTPAVSPDGRMVAVARLDSHSPTQDIWLIDADNGPPRRLTFDAGMDHAPVWSPDGTRIVYGSRRPEKADLYVKSVTGTGPAQLLLSQSVSIFPVDWSRDGNTVMFMQSGRQSGVTPARGFNIWALPLLGERTPFAAVETPAYHARLSPDGRWLAYDSDETGTSEVYVQPFPPTTSERWQISDHGGNEPKWRGDGKELYYLGPDQRLMVVRIRTSSRFESEPALALFEAPSVAGNTLGLGNKYEVAPDGQRFLFNAPPGGPSKPITIVVNWAATLPH
jgi:serine/threonine protein kinase/Tol biopolymer transport system component